MYSPPLLHTSSPHSNTFVLYILNCIINLFTAVYYYLKCFEHWKKIWKMTSKPQLEKVWHNDVLGLAALLDPEVCYCIPGDNASGTCPCCEENYISCGVSAPGVCVQQDVAWLCHKVRPGMILLYNCVEVLLNSKRVQNSTGIWDTSISVTLMVCLHCEWDHKADKIISRPFMNYAESVIFLHLSVILFTGGSAWQGEGRWQRGMCGGRWGVQVCMAGGCMVGCIRGKGHVCWGDVHGRVHAWQCDTATAADGTHPTGMHSCFLISLLKWSTFRSDSKQIISEHWQLTQYEWSQSSYVCNRRFTEDSNKLHSCFQQTSWKGPWNGILN